jgi:hypothetical protein
VLSTPFCSGRIVVAGASIGAISGSAEALS